MPRKLLPEVSDCAADYGASEAALFGRSIPIRGVAGDQQAATIGQACFSPGMIKSTYGTGCFVVLNTGDKLVRSKNRLISTLAYRLNGKPTYALEGSIFVSGAAIRFDGQVAVFDCRDPTNPCYHCLFGEGDEFEETRCATMGVFAPLVGIIGATQAAEALKILAGTGRTLAGRLLLLDALTMEWREVRVVKDPQCPVCGEGRL